MRTRRQKTEDGRPEDRGQRTEGGGRRSSVLRLPSSVFCLLAFCLLAQAQVPGTRWEDYPRMTTLTSTDLFLFAQSTNRYRVRGITATNLTTFFNTADLSLTAFNTNQFSTNSATWPIAIKDGARITNLNVGTRLEVAGSTGVGARIRDFSTITDGLGTLGAGMTWNGSDFNTTSTNASTLVFNGNSIELWVRASTILGTWQPIGGQAPALEVNSDDSVTFGHHLLPSTTDGNTENIGSLSALWATIYGTSLNLSGAASVGSLTATNGITDQSIGASKVVRTDGAGTLQDVSIGTGLAFDGTTLSATATSTSAFIVDSDELIQANVSALGPAGTNAFVIVGGSSNYETNGLNLITAYAAAKLKTPHGFALNATNHYTILLLPGKYRVTGGALVLDAQFIDLVGISPNTGSVFYDAAVGVDTGDTVIESSGDTITVNAPSDSDHTLQNLAVITTSAGNKAFQTTDNARKKERLINVLLYNTSGLLNLSMAENVHYEGTYVDVRAWNHGSFGYRSSGADINAGGFFLRCKASAFAFGASLVDTHGTANGTFIDCEADGVSFGRLIANGTFLGCRFVSITGTAGGMFGANTTRSGSFIDCLDPNGVWFSDVASTYSLQLVDPWMTNVARFQEITDPATPATNNLVIYAKDNGSAQAALYYKRDDGTVVGPLGTGGGVTNVYVNGAVVNNPNFTNATDINFSVGAATNVTASINAGAITDSRVNASGITTRSKLPSQIAYEDEVNTFSSAQTFNGNASFAAQLVFTDVDMAGGTNVDVTKRGPHRKSVSGTTTLAFSGSPQNDSHVLLIATNTAAAKTTLNVPSSYRPLVGTITSLTLLPSSSTIIVWSYINGSWYIEVNGDQVKDNLAATTNPAVGDDANDGYSIGSTWLNTSTDTAWVCTDDTVGAALWKNTTGDEFGYSALTYSGGTNVTINLAVSREFYLTLTNTAFFATPSNIPTNGATFFVKLKQDATGARSVTWTNTTFKFPGGTVPTITTNANAVDVITCTLSPFTQGQVYAVQTADFK